jgi:hypothetical protein
LASEEPRNPAAPVMRKFIRDRNYSTKEIYILNLCNLREHLFNLD